MKNLAKSYQDNGKDAKAALRLAMTAFYYASNVEKNADIAEQYVVLFADPDTTKYDLVDKSGTLTGKALWSNSDVSKLVLRSYLENPTIARSYFKGTKLIDNWKLPADVTTLDLEYLDVLYDDPGCTHCGPGTAYITIQNQDISGHAWPDHAIMIKRADGYYHINDFNQLCIAPVDSTSPDFASISDFIKNGGRPTPAPSTKP
jgi:hypothetical protein